MSHIVFHKDFAKYPLHYFTLVCLQLLGLWGVFWFSYDPPTQLLTIVLMAASFVVWGWYHHRIHRDLHPKIVMEYLLVALLAVVLVGSLILRA